VFVFSFWFVTVIASMNSDKLKGFYDKLTIQKTSLLFHIWVEMLGLSVILFNVFIGHRNLHGA